MKRFRECIRFRPLDLNRVDDFTMGFGSRLNEIPQEDPIPSGFGVLREYEAIMEIGARFRCNEAQLPMAKQQAVDMLIRETYSDLLIYLQRLRVAIDSGDRPAAMNLVNELEQQYLGD